MPGVSPPSLPLIKWSADFIQACEALLFSVSVALVSTAWPFTLKSPEEHISVSRLLWHRVGNVAKSLKSFAPLSKPVSYDSGDFIHLPGQCSAFILNLSTGHSFKR